MKWALVLGCLMSFHSSWAKEFDSYSVQEIETLALEELSDVYTKDSCEAYGCDLPLSTQNPSYLLVGERHALKNFTASDWQWVNDLLEGEGPKEVVEFGFIRLMDSALEKIKSRELTVYSGTKKNSAMIPGEEIVIRSYLSTSLDFATAQEFIDDRLLIISAKRGKLISYYSNAPNEKEILIPRGSRFHVDKVIRRKNFAGKPWERVEKMIEVVYLTELP
jgi:hypothetical protein